MRTAGPFTAPRVLFSHFLAPVLVALLAVPAASAPRGAQWYDVSEYLLGTVYVKVFFLESSSRSADTENWTTQEKTWCKEALEKALGQIRKRFVGEFETVAGSGRLPTGVRLDFITDYETAEVSVEPIGLDGSGILFSTGDLKIWVNEVMAAKGFSRRTPPEGMHPLLPYPPYQYNVAEYADYLRNTMGTDWATVIFFYDNSADADGLFANGKPAGPPMGLGGPGLLFSNNRGRPFIERQRTPRDPESFIGMIHEFLHVWYAVDEHPANKHFRGDAVIGYLAGPNLNYDRAKGLECSMYSANLYWPRICEYTKKQIGWTDSDGDRIPDILDVPPVVEELDEVAGDALSLRGRAVSPPLGNRNPYSEGGTIRPPYDLSVVLHLAAVPERRLGLKDFFRKVPGFTPPFPWTRNDITVNTLTAVEYALRKDGVTVADWTAALPSDGAFDSAEEEFHFSVGPLAPGSYTLEVRAKNSVGLASGIMRMTLKR